MRKRGEKHFLAGPKNPSHAEAKLHSIPAHAALLPAGILWFEEELSQILGIHADFCSKLSRHMTQSIGNELLLI
jgi:hypothetical protein